MAIDIAHYRDQLGEVSVKNAHRLSRDLDFLAKRRAQHLPIEKKLEQFETALARALDDVAARRRSVPEIDLPAELPITHKYEQIATAIRQHQVLILAGETGSGKTTQIPKICLSIGRGIRGRIGHTQPRRIAARTVASRIAEEVKTALGAAVGYQVRFTDHTQKDTFVKLMTDGILLAEIQHDPLLLSYDTLIIDEAHERSLNIDFLLGYLKRLLPRRPDLKIVVTSATIDVERFSAHFDNAPTIEVSGRTYPVETVYRPWQETFEDINDGIVAVVEEILTTRARGDILVFLSGEREIREASHALKQANFPHLEVLPLYARLSLAEQNRIFHPGRGGRIILATNVAETSITVPGIKYVVDPGYARVSRYSVRTKVQRLPVEAISRASADQRKGRCGRLSDGVCFRLYEQEDFANRAEFTDAEILRTNLAAVILQMLHMRLGDVRDFPFVDQPDARLISDGFKLLEEIKAVTPSGKVSTLGRALSKLPVDPRLGVVLMQAADQDCLREALIVVAALSVQDPRERPADKQQAADAKHRRFNDEHSDFVAYLNLWDYLEGQRQVLSQNQFRKLCQREFISYLRVREWRDLHRQLRLAVKDLKLRENHRAAGYEPLHRALICGYLSQIGLRDSEKNSRDYLGTRQKRFAVFPGSSQAKKKNKWILAAQFIETSRLFAHCVARIEPQWVLDYAGHQCKKHYFEPRYEAKSGQVRAFVRTTYLGLVLQEKKSVAYHKVDAKAAADIFVRQALVEGKYRASGDFFRHNQGLIAAVHELEAKSRRRDIMVNEEVIFEFYRAAVPADITNLAGFERWRKEVEKTDPRHLYLTKNQLMLHQAEGISGQQFPAELTLGDHSFQVNYSFEPGKLNDGVNLQVPVELLHDIQEHRLEWLVPGLLREKCMALVKSLPKASRKHFVPVPEFVDKVLPRLQPGNTRLTEALGAALGHISNKTIAHSEWNEDGLDDFYKINIQVIDEQAKVIDQSRDIRCLREKYRAQVQNTLAKVGDEIERRDLTRWDFASLPASVQLRKGKVRITAYPALVSKRNGVDLKVMDNPLEASFVTKFGVLRLAALACAETTKYLQRQLLKGNDLALSVLRLGKREDVIDDVILAAIGDAVFIDDTVPLTKTQFEQLLQAGRSNIVASAEKYECLLIEILDKMLAIKKTLKAHKNPLSIALAAGDINAQLEALVVPGFLRRTPFARLLHYPRYLSAIVLRLEKVGQNPARDSAYTRCLQEMWQQHSARLASEGEWSYAQNAQWQQFRWMIEELRVSFFAQTLKTQVPVSEKRLQKQWNLSLSP